MFAIEASQVYIIRFGILLDFSSLNHQSLVVFFPVFSGLIADNTLKAVLASIIVKSTPISGGTPGRPMAIVEYGKQSSSRNESSYFRQANDQAFVKPMPRVFGNS
ncbi:MAG TPA: hypothetical protein DD473_09800 [Planctomycetaceae bacterium]|nr:hypothetical protein [Planctomycetaceae bacterium]